MTELDRNSYQNHKNASVGDIVKATDSEGTKYSGTVMQKKGATVYVQSENGTILEFRRLKDGDIPVIVLGIDGKNSVDQTSRQKGNNKDDIEVTSESWTLSFNHQIVDFSTESTEHKLG